MRVGAGQKKKARAVTNGSKALVERERESDAERLEAAVNRILFDHKHIIAPQHPAVMRDVNPEVVQLF